MILLSLKFWPKVIFWETPGVFWVAEKKTKGFFGVAKKGLRDFWGYAKKGSDFHWQTNSEVVISLGIKYKPLSPPPLPSSLKFVSGATGEATVTSKQYHNLRAFGSNLKPLVLPKRVVPSRALHGLNKQKVVLSRRVTPASW